jgi:hypothetical protein
MEQKFCTLYQCGSISLIVHLPNQFQNSEQTAPRRHNPFHFDFKSGSKVESFAIP